MKIMSDFRVVIEIPDSPALSKDTKLYMARRIQDEIVRHVDYEGQVVIKWDLRCSHCGSIWEDPPECCKLAMEEHAGPRWRDKRTAPEG